MENVADMGDVGGDDGGKGEDGSWDKDGRVGAIGDIDCSEMEDAVEGRLHCVCEFDFPVIFRGARTGMVSSIDRDVGSDVDAYGCE
jgi:hypothetical protein